MIMSPQSLSFVIAGILITIVGTTPKIEAQKTTSLESRDAAIREALVSISTGKLPPNDENLIKLIGENLMEVAINAKDPTAGIDAAARQAQEAVSEVTAAYTAIIFQSSSVYEARRLFDRFQDTVDKIVDFAKSGNFIAKY